MNVRKSLQMGSLDVWPTYKAFERMHRNYLFLNCFHLVYGVVYYRYYCCNFQILIEWMGAQLFLYKLSTTMPSSKDSISNHNCRRIHVERLICMYVLILPSWRTPLFTRGGGTLKGGEKPQISSKSGVRTLINAICLISYFRKTCIFYI